MGIRDLVAGKGSAEVAMGRISSPRRHHKQATMRTKRASQSGLQFLDGTRKCCITLVEIGMSPSVLCG